MIRSTEPIIYSINPRTGKTESGIITEIVTNYTRMPLTREYQFEVLFLVDGKPWKKEFFKKPYLEVDMLKEQILADNIFVETGSDLDDMILKHGLKFVAILDQHFGITPDKWRFLNPGEDLFFKIPEPVFPDSEGLDMPDETIEPVSNKG